MFHFFTKQKKDSNMFFYFFGSPKEVLKSTWIELVNIFYYEKKN